MSSESTPILSRAISDFEMFMTKWEKLGVQHQVLKFWTKISLHWAKKYYIWMDETNAYVITMCKIYLSLICHHFSPQLKLTVLNPAVCYAWTLGTFLSALWRLDCLLYGYGIMQMWVAIPGTL